MTFLFDIWADSMKEFSSINCLLRHERMVRRLEKGIYHFIPESQAGKIARTDIVIEKGEVIFLRSNQERKMTGSYYTPENIVRFIVEKAIGTWLEI